MTSMNMKTLCVFKTGVLIVKVMKAKEINSVNDCTRAGVIVQQV